MAIAYIIKASVVLRDAVALRRWPYDGTSQGHRTALRLRRGSRRWFLAVSTKSDAILVSLGVVSVQHCEPARGLSWGRDKRFGRSIQMNPAVITVREAARLQGFPDWFRFHPTVWHSFQDDREQCVADRRPSAT